MPREANIVKIVGHENYLKLRNSKILLVGAGGIGSELLKDLILMEFGEIHIVDLDTIDLSNLNRQFLFRQRDIKKPKSTTAVNAVNYFSNSKLYPYQGNIMDTNQFPLHWFDQFNIIFNALDNLVARRYVNKISQFLLLPLLESGTSGFDGYIQPIIPQKTECFDCTTKETPKTFPVCTIRSTPAQPIHCIVWAKNVLFSQLFSTLIEDNEKDENLSNWGTEDKQEIERIKQETNELHELQKIISLNDTSRIKIILEKLFIQDIEKLLLIDNLWKTRAKPKPLTKSLINESEKIDHKTLKLNEIWSLQEQISRFIFVTKTLINRYSIEKSIEFDKDDEDTLEFVVTAANIRSHIFGIQMKSVFDSKQMAGNIIPAIATTNAIIAGLSALTSLRVLNLLKSAPTKSATELNMAFTTKASNISQDRYLSNPNLVPSNDKCAACSKVCRGVLNISKEKLNNLKLSELLDLLRENYKYPADISVIDTNDQRLLADFDFNDLLDRSLSSLKLGDGSILLFTDDEGDDETNLFRKPFELYIVVLEDKGNDYIKFPKLEIPLVKVEAETEETSNEDEVNETVALNEGTIILLDDDSVDESVPSKRLRPVDGTEDDKANKKAKIEMIDVNEDIIELD